MLLGRRLKVRYLDPQGVDGALALPQFLFSCTTPLCTNMGHMTSLCGSGNILHT